MKNEKFFSPFFFFFFLKPFFLSLASDDELFALDEFAPPSSQSLSASFNSSRLGRADEELDELQDLPASHADLLTLLHREKTHLASESEGVSKSLVPSFAEWLVASPVNEVDVVENVTKSLSSKCLGAVSELREKLRRMDTFGASAERSNLEQQIDVLLWEAGTWDLLHTTLADLRQAEGQENAEALAKAAADKWISDEHFFVMASRMDSGVRRAKRVAAWLEHVQSTQSTLSGSVRSEKFWEATSRSLANGVTVERDVQTGSERQLVTNLDPDAPLRQENQQLHSVDVMTDQRLLRRVWELIRCGRLGQAVAECNACQQQWRSATLMGMLPFHDPKAVNPADPADARGNSSATLLREVCSQLGECTKLNQHERAMYGLFAGSIAPVLAVSSSFHDFLWAHYKVNLLHRVLALRQRNGGREGLVVEPKSDQEIMAAVMSAAPASQASSPHARIQRAIIMGELNELVLLLSTLQADASSSTHLHRFSTTALLVLSKVRAPELNPSPALLLNDTHRSIHVYLERVVGELGRPSTVVALALHLPEADRVPFVARFIAQSMEEYALQESRELDGALLLAESEERVRDAARKLDRRTRFIQALEAGGLNTVQVLLQVFRNMLPPDHGEVRAFNFGTTSESGDTMGSHRALIEVLGWLTVRQEHWMESAQVANDIARQLALRHRVSHIKDVLRALPVSTLDLCRENCKSRDENASFAFEIEFWRALVDAYDAFAAWHGARSSDGSAGLVTALYEGAEAALRRIIDFPDRPLFEFSNTLRSTQLALVRDCYIPQVFLMLHNLHYNSQRYDLSLALADDVADRRKKLWTVFVRNGKLEQFMSLMKQSSMMIYARGHRDLVGFDAI